MLRSTGKARGSVSLLAALATWPVAAAEDAGFVTAIADASAFSQAATSLDADEARLFASGRAEFHERWVAPLSIGGTWGRGPTFNAEACSDCHAGNGAGRPPAHGDTPPHSMLVRLSIPGASVEGGPLPHPHYGDQLQDQGELGKVPAEGEFHIDWREHEETFDDGEVVRMRTPILRLGRLQFGSLERETLRSARIAPPVFGLGLLEAVDDETLEALAAAQPAMGLRGRINRVWDIESRTHRSGRFGWKAGQPTLRQQNAGAFHRDIGVTTRMFPEENCPPVQRACRLRPGTEKPEQDEASLEALNFYLRALAAPAARHRHNSQAAAGQKIFTRLACDGCHVPQLRTGHSAIWSALADQAVPAYTDLMLHDMGEDLADGRPEFAAGPRDWRTAPLWGLGLRKIVNGNFAMLHDGRARTYAEAILWHGGEALSARQAFMRLDREQRAALSAFLDAL
ncbi:MAG: di-heme oxidoredictase family protein [Burkholderiales bacterium]